MFVHSTVLKGRNVTITGQGPLPNTREASVPPHLHNRRLVWVLRRHILFKLYQFGETGPGWYRYEHSTDPVHLIHWRKCRLQYVLYGILDFIGKLTFFVEFSYLCALDLLTFVDLTCNKCVVSNRQVLASPRFLRHTFLPEFTKL